MNTRWIYWVLLASCLCVTSSWARPPKVTVEKTEGDATVTLTLEDNFIKDDSLIPCRLTVLITGTNQEFTEGDTVKVFLMEDDTPFIGLFDDALWGAEEIVEAETATAQRFDRVYDCSFASVGDILGGLEIYARVEVNKQSCNTFCELNPLGGEDTPTTNNISMGEMVDDPSEEDDISADAFPLPRRGASDRIARDTDWFKVTYSQPVEFLARLETDFAGGDLDLTLYSSDLTVVAEAMMEAGGEAKRLTPPTALLPGEYLLEVSLPDPANFNFYDLIITESQISTDCAPGVEDTRSCTRCGVERRTCSEEGEWSEWSTCMDQGTCDPGSEEIQGCGDNGSQSRVCNMECQWGAYETCTQCEDGESEPCYDGAQGVAGVGACVQGMRSCSRGQWSSCQGDVLPNIEVCQDGIDNDCDGMTDRNDPECVAGLGDPCAPGECSATFECLPAPFIEGYCGGLDCSQCGVGSVCGSAFGEEYCLKPCASVVDCRIGYVCAAAGSNGEQVCIPPCVSDESCGSGSVCNEQQVCEATAGGGGGSVGSAPKPAEEGCQQSNRGIHGFLIACLLLLLIRRGNAA